MMWWLGMRVCGRGSRRMARALCRWGWMGRGVRGAGGGGGGAVSEGELGRRLSAEAERAVDLGSEVPLRVVLFELGAEDHVLSLVCHHIATDGWSLRPLVRGLLVACEGGLRGESTGWSALPVQAGRALRSGGAEA